MSAFFGYYAVIASLIVGTRSLFPLSGEWFRKVLHFVPVMSVFVVLYAFDSWQLAMLTPLVFATVAYAAIAVLERRTGLLKMLEERRKGEIRSSIVLVFVMMATLVAVFWGWLGPDWKYVIILAVMAWGFGDAAAALVGTTWGRRHIRHRLVDGRKTWEGTRAMLVVSAVAIFATLIVHADLPWYTCAVVATAVAPVCTFVELVSRNGIDTLTVPFATAIAAFVALQILSTFGA